MNDEELPANIALQRTSRCQRAAAELKSFGAVGPQQFTRRRMKLLLAALAFAAAAMATPMAFAQTSRAPGELLDRIAGRWVLEGTLAGKQTTHDVVASSVLNGQYVQLHEVSRDLDVHGRPVYEALVYLTWEDSRGEYSCLWLDSTSNVGLSNGVSGRAKPSGDEIALTFRYPSGNMFHTTLAYDRAADKWQWRMDDEEKGRRVPFARMVMRHKQHEK